MSERGSIAFLGDSITNHGHWDLWFPGRMTFNLGVSGDTTDDVIRRLDSVTEWSPARLAILIGTNDLGTGRTVEHLVRNIELILVVLRRDLPEAGVLLQSIMPREAEFAEQVKDANRHLRQFAPSVNADYLDLWPVLAREDGEIRPEFSDDRLHLNDEGYRVWLDELRPVIAP